MVAPNEMSEEQKKGFSQKIKELKEKVFNIKKKERELEEEIGQKIDQAKAEDLLDDIQGSDNINTNNK